MGDDQDTIFVDIDRLNRYAKFRMNIRVREGDGKTTRNMHFITGMKHCDISEFEAIGV